MNLLLMLRSEDGPLVTALQEAGHELYAPASYAAQFNGVYPVDWPTDPHATPGWLGFEIVDKLSEWAAIAPRIIDTIKSLHSRTHLDGFIVWTDAPPSMRLAVLACKSLGIHTFEVTHGAMNTYRQGHFECESYVDTILAPGQEEVDFRAFYEAKAEVVITGKPSFDWMADINIQESRALISERLSLPSRRPVILYGMTWRHPFSTWERDRNIGMQEVFEAHMNLLTVCNPFLIIKPHYSAASHHNIKELHEMCDQSGLTDYGIIVCKTPDILPAVDLIVSHKSSLLVEGVLMDIPAVGFDFREMNDFARYADKGIEWVSKRDDLMPAMARCLLDNPTRIRLKSERHDSASYFNGPNDGHASTRCVEVIQSKEITAHAQASSN